MIFSKYILGALALVVIVIVSVVVFSGCTASNPAGTTPSMSTLPGAGTGNGGLGRGPAPVALGTAASYVILAKSAISNVPTSAITGSLGLSPAADTSITGFSLIRVGVSSFATSTQVNGSIYASNYAAPTPTNLITAVNDMQTAYTDASGRGPDYTDLGAGNITGWTLAPATYKWGTGLIITGDVILNGGPNDVWIFEVAQGITMAPNARIVLIGGALPKNIFWQSFGVVSIGTNAHMEGVMLSQTSITLQTGATANSRFLAQTAVTLQSNTIVQPAP